MAKPRVLTVRTLSSFTKTVEEALGDAKARHRSASYTSNWYRGHGCADQYRLLPTLYRHPRERNIENLLNMERSMLDEFSRQSVLHPPEIAHGTLNERFARLFYVQHYGVPTRLLDWTSNPFIALYFALTDDQNRRRQEGAAIWVLDPVSWNNKAMEELTWGNRGPALPEDQELKSYYPLPLYTAADIKQMYEYPVATRGIANNARMFAQKGTFTVFGKRRDTIEDIYERKDFPADCLLKVLVPHGKIAPMLGALTSIGYTDSVSYPDLHGLALEIKRLNGFAP